MDTAIQKENVNQDDKIEDLSLHDFIAENDKTLAVIGILVGIAAFFPTLPTFKSYTTLISFLCLLATFPLFITLFKRTVAPNKRVTLLLLIFTNFLTLIIINIAWFVLVAFREQWKAQLSSLMVLILLLCLLVPFQRKYQDLFVRWYLMKTLWKWRLNSIKKQHENLTEEELTQRQKLESWIENPVIPDEKRKELRG